MRLHSLEGMPASNVKEVTRCGRSGGDGAVAIVRHPAHLDSAHRLVCQRQTHFVCLSLGVFLLAGKRALSCSLPIDYEAVRNRDFLLEGHRLAREWVRTHLTHTLLLSEELEAYLTTRYTFFFATKLFSTVLIEAVTHTLKPQKVYLWRDPRRPIVDDWSPGAGEGSIFADAALDWLADRNIAVEFLDRPTAPVQPSRSFRSALVGALPYSLRAVLRHVRLGAGLLNRRRQRLAFLYRMAVRSWLRARRSPTTVLLAGASVDAVYQAELEQRWKEAGRPWRLLRFESHDSSALRARRLARNGNLPLGLSLERALDALVPQPPVQGTALSTDQSVAILESLPPNSVLGYQYAAMVRDAHSILERIRFLRAFLSRISPQCVVSHQDAGVAIAARQLGIPSVVVAHGGIFSPELVSMHGDRNVIAGDLQKRFYERIHGDSRRFAAAGLPNIPERRDTSDRRGPVAHVVPTVLFLVTDSDYYCWDTPDFRIYLAGIEALRCLAEADQVSLTVKLHPRYAQHALYASLLSEHPRVRLDARPALEELLANADVVVVSGLTTALIEALSCGVATIAYFAHTPLATQQTPYHQALRDGLITAPNPEELSRHVIRLCQSSEARRQAVERQSTLLPSLLAGAGREAALRVADLCQDLMDHQDRFMED
jgi:glycosyltransferase involved in cell wall biosynthesis